MEYKGYSARVIFDEDAALLFGEVEGLRDIVTFEATDVAGLAIAFHESVDDYLAMCAERGEEPEKPFSGKFLMRVDPRLHREAALRAARMGKSLNAFTADLLKAWLRNARQDEMGQRPDPLGVANARSVGEAAPAYVAERHDPPTAFEHGQQPATRAATRNTPAFITPARTSDATPTSQGTSAKTPASKKERAREAA